MGTTSPVPLVNGEAVLFRFFTEAENAKIRKQQAEFLSFWYERGKPRGIVPNTARQYHVEILVPCKPGDNLTFDHHPKEYDQLWVRFPLVDGGSSTNKGNMMVSGKNPGDELCDG